MSEDEEESFGFYGRPLEQYDEDAIPKKRPISVEEQIATDTQGRRRFHGAFTGGFSAGFFNTVGSVEGWRPTEFKSSRAEKAEQKVQRPEDYMDDEDVGEFGIAPQTVRATKDYNTSKKRKKQVFSDGPIPGDPVLHTLIENSSETIGYILLRNMGFKHSPPEDEHEEDVSVEGTSKKVYGCEMPRAYEVKKSVTNVKTYIPEIYKSALANPKSNSFGLGYSGLDKGHVELFTSSNLVVKERDNKKLSISGQAFGVGAFEEEDEDIYVKEDLTKYDFEMTAEKRSAATAPPSGGLVLKLFVPGKNILATIQSFPPPPIPHSFTGKHKVKRSRFEPAVEAREPPKRHEINANFRAEALGEQQTEVPKRRDIFLEIIDKSKKRESKFDVMGDKKPKTEAEAGMSGLLFDKFVSATKSEDHLNILEPVRSSGTTHGTQDMRDAARMKMFGPLTRVVLSWSPVSLVYRRFNIPDPVYSETEMKPKTRIAKNLIFESEKFKNDPITIRNSGLQTTRNGTNDREKLSSENSEQVNSETVIPNSNEVYKQHNELVTSDQMEVDTLVTTLNEPTLIALSEPTSSIDKNEKFSNSKSLDITDKIDVSKNVDLFKAIFVDSDDDVSDNDGQTEEVVGKDEALESLVREQAIKEQVLSEDLLLPKINTTKAGILSNIDFDSFRPKFEKKRAPVEEKTDDVSLYGPKLPIKIVTLEPIGIGEAKGVNDEWIEKDEVEKKEHKHKRKHKKEKHKKKHKHKK